MDSKIYEIGGTKYEQRPLVWAQVRQLAALLPGFTINLNAGVQGLIVALGDKIPAALAVVLNPVGVSLKNKDLATLAEELEYAISPEQVLEVVEDFFTCTPVASLLERLAGTINQIGAGMAKETGLSKSSATLPAETSPSEITSSGT